MELNSYIDHTLLKPDATYAQIEAVAQEAIAHHFASVCANPIHVKRLAAPLAGTGVHVCTVIGFPPGANAPEVKAFEAETALRDGAEELDMVINVGALKSGDLALVKRDIEGVVRAAAGHIVKVIIETGLLTGEEKRTACRLAKEAGASFVKTCTGFSGGAANAQDIRLMRETVGPEMGVKASGGIRSRESALELIAAGANRIGTSSGLTIISGEKC